MKGVASCDMPRVGASIRRSDGSRMRLREKNPEGFFSFPLGNANSAKGNICGAGGKEITRDAVSSGERKRPSPTRIAAVMQWRCGVLLATYTIQSGASCSLLESNTGEGDSPV